MRDDKVRFPVVIVEDRYGGLYTGHKWIAFPQFDEDYKYSETLEDGVWGDDLEALDWAINNRGKYWGGDTPQEAVDNLYKYYPNVQPHNGIASQASDSE